MRTLFSLGTVFLGVVSVFAADPFAAHGKLRVAKSGTYLEHADGTPFFVLADTAWTGPAPFHRRRLATLPPRPQEEGLHRRPVQRRLPVAHRRHRPRRPHRLRHQGRQARPQRAVLQAARRPASRRSTTPGCSPCRCWSGRTRPATPGSTSTRSKSSTLVKFELNRYKDANCVFILAGDARYTGDEGEKWKRIGRAVVRGHPGHCSSPRTRPA